jgi:hypothetical protein
VNNLRTLSLGKKGNGKTALSRRALLKALGVTAAAAPLIPSLDGWAAGNEAAKKRLLLLFTPDGIVPDLYWPTGTETNFTFPMILAPLERHKADMIVFKNLTRATGGSGGAHEHAMGGLWTGNSIAGNQGMAPSVDQVIAQKLPKGTTDFQSLQFGVQSYFQTGDANAKAASVNSYMIYSGPKARMPAESNPYTMFDRLFANFAPSVPGSGTVNMDRVRQERQSIIDYLKSDVTDVQVKLGKDDRDKLGKHLDAIRDIERRLVPGAGGPSASCSPGTKPAMLDMTKNETFPDLIKVMNKILVAAFACDRTRIASMQYSRGFSNAIHSYLGAKETHHTLSHGTQNAPILAKIQTFYMTHIAELFDDLKAVNEGGVPMMDNMLIAYANEVYLGWTHGCSPSPCWFAGKLAGAVKPGRFIDWGGKQDHNQMLTTLAHAMGVDVPKVGDLGSPGTLPNIVT